MSNSLETLKRQLQQLKELHASGVIPAEQFESSRTLLEKQILETVLAPPLPGQSRAKWPLWGGVMAFVLLFSGLGYWWKGDWSSALSSPRPGAGSTTAATAMSPEPAPHTTENAQMAGMVEQLAQRLRKSPDDAEGWAMLARSYTVLGKRQDALKAYARALALRKEDPDLLADYADAMAMESAGQLGKESMKLVERALRIDPRNLKALALSGTYAFERKDYAGAARYWEQVTQFGPSDNPMVQQAQAGLAEIRTAAGTGTTPSAKPPGTATAPTDSTSVSGVVSLSPALKTRLAESDTVFIFAQAAEGPRMPLAVLRKQVKDLPFQFRLDDSMAMAPAMRLSTAGQVVIGARISKSGNATPQSGDISAKTAPVAVGSTDIRLEVR